MSKEHYEGWDTINIPASNQIFEAEYRIVESEWVVCADGITKTAHEFNRKTGETRPYSYAKAMRAMFG